MLSTLVLTMHPRQEIRRLIRLLVFNLDFGGSGRYQGCCIVVFLSQSVRYNTIVGESLHKHRVVPPFRGTAFVALLLEPFSAFCSLLLPVDLLRAKSIVPQVCVR